MKRLWRLSTATVVLCGIGSAGRVARANELELSTGVGALASSWPSDAGPYSTLKIGYRWHDWISADLLTRVGYGPVDTRMETYFSVGVELWGRALGVRPHARLGVVHSHEESKAALEVEPFGALFGVGDGIRHRAGMHLGGGVDVPIGAWHGHPFFVAIETAATWFPDPRGPTWYWGGGVSLAMDWAL